MMVTLSAGAFAAGMSYGAAHNALLNGYVRGKRENGKWFVDEDSLRAYAATRRRRRPMVEDRELASDQEDVTDNDGLPDEEQAHMAATMHALKTERDCAKAALRTLVDLSHGIGKNGNKGRAPSREEWEDAFDRAERMLD